MGGTVHHISHQLPQLSRPNKGFRHKREGHFQCLLNLQDHSTTSHTVIPCSTKHNFHCGGECSPHISAAPQWNLLKQKSQTPMDCFPLASVKVTNALHHFPQSYSHFHIPHIEKSANFTMGRIFTPYLNDHQTK